MTDVEPKKHRTKLTLEQEHNRRLEIIRLRRQGMSTAAIAKKVRMRKQAVVEIIHQLHMDWRDRVAADYDTLIAEEVGELYMLRARAFESFAQSQTSKNKSGSSKWLELARRTTVDIANLLGLTDREVFEMRRAAPADPEQIKAMELVVSDREEIEQLRDENGNISLTAYLKKIRKPTTKEGNGHVAAGG
jgi:hypothetical protein